MHHTPEPWNRNVSPAWKYPIYASASGDESKRDWIHIAAVLPKNPNAEADLDRIVACVNACAGIAEPDKAIPAMLDILRAIDLGNGMFTRAMLESVRKALGGGQ